MEASQGVVKGRGLTIEQLRCLPPQAGQEDRNLTTRQIRVHILRQDDCEATLDRYLALQRMQEGRSRHLQLGDSALPVD